jgi:putative tryptophan/tyrosine transport system substrate-binding protein
MPSNSTMPTVGFLCPCTLVLWKPWIDAFETQLATHGWTKGKTIDIDYQEASGLNKNYITSAKYFVGQKVNVIVTGGTQATIACKNEAAKAKIPVVFGTAGDPVDTKLVPSYDQPGNLTGMSNQQTNLVIKRLDIVRRLLKLSTGKNKNRVGLVGNDQSPNVKLEMKIAKLVAPTLGLKLREGHIRKQKDIGRVIRGLKGKVEFLLVCTDPLITTNAYELNAEAANARLPTMHAFKEYLQWGGFVSHGPKFEELFQNTADMVDKILRGQAGPNMSNIPVGMTEDFESMINLGPHGPFPSLGLTVPPSMLTLFDKVIR